MFFGVLGALVVQDGEPPVSLSVPGAKERALLGRLLVSPSRVVPVDLLIADLWESGAPASARRSLQAHVVRLRSALEPQRPKGSPGRFVVRRGDGYALMTESKAVDSTLAAAWAAEGRSGLTGGDPAGARELLRAAEALWRGEPFVDWRDAAWAQVERRRLQDLRAMVMEARLDADLALGCHREVIADLEALVVEEPLHEGWWTRLMLALYRSDRQADALAAGRRARSLLVEELGVDAGPGLRQMEQAILDQSDVLDASVPSPRRQVRPANGPPSTACPYRGLTTYEAGDAAVFYGRAAVLRSLVSRTLSARLVVVSGSSGAGKSSLVRAGLLPALAQGVIPGSDTWRPVVVTPGRRPVDRLAPLLSPDQDDGGDATASLPVLVIDQFEELWTAGAPEDERGAFLDAVLALLDDGVVARVIVVVRGDHLGRLGEHPGMAERAADGMLLVPPLTEVELREVVQGPATVAGLMVDPDLVEAVVRDVHGQPAALPLLSTALVATWERRRDAMLTLTGYLEAGGVTGALARTAETALACLDEAGRSLARPLFVRLVATGEAGTVVRRQVPISELGFEGPQGPVRRALVEAFVSRRLLAIGAEYLEVTHEALLIAWPRLAGWLAEDAVGRAVRTHLAPEARGWDSAGRPADRLYRGARLAAAQDWLGRPDADPTAVERDFVAASTASSEAELEQSRAQTRRERAGRRRTRRLAAVLAVAMVMALGAGALAAQRQRQADASALRADANRLAAASGTTPALDIALLLAAEAYRTEHTPQTEDALLAGAVQHRQVARVYRADGVPRRIAVSSDGRTLYAHADQQVVAWDLASNEKRVLRQYQSSTQFPADVKVSPALSGPHAGLVAIVTPPEPGISTSSTIRLLEPDGQVRWTRGSTELGGWPVAIEFTADGAQVAVEYIEDYGGGHPVIVHDLMDSGSGTTRRVGPSTPATTIIAYDPWVSGMAKSAGAVFVGMPERPGVFDLARGATTWLDPQGRDTFSSVFIPVVGGVLEGAGDGAMWWYPSGARTPRQKLADHTRQVLSAATDAAGTVLVTGGYDHRVVVHRRDSEGNWVTRDVLTGHQGAILEIAVSPDGQRAFSTSEDRTVIAWDLTDKGRFGTLIPEVEEPTNSEPRPLVLGTPALVGDPQVWVIPVVSKPPGRPSGPGAAVFMDPRSGRILDWVWVGTREVIPIPFAAAVASRDGSRVAVTTQFSTTVLDVRDHHVQGTVELDDVDGVRLGLAGPVPEPVATVAWSADGSRMFLGAGVGAYGSGVGATGAVVVVNTATWRPEHRVLAGSAVNALATSPDGRLLAVGYESGKVLLADANTYDVVRTLTAHVGPVRSVAFSPDGSRLAAVGGNKRLDVWDVADGRPVLDPPPYMAGAGVSVRWEPDGSTVVFGGDDGLAVRYDVVHDIVRGVPLPAFRDGGGGYVFLAPARGDQLGLLPGARAIGVPREGMIYSLDPADWLARACDIVQRDLSAAEWATYLPERPHRSTCTDLIR